MLLLNQISEKLLKSGMNILVIGTNENLLECQEKFGDRHTFIGAEHQQNAEKHFPTTDVIFDFNIHRDVSQMEVYRDHPGVTAFLNTTFISLRALGQAVEHRTVCALFGFCGLPTFLNRPVLETTLYRSKDQVRLQEVCDQLGSKFLTVDDRVGLVTPRIIAMIINEAYYTVQEKTANKVDIDQAMKLGTNYPWGPFEWAQKVGLQNVVKLLSSIYADTQDERYKIAPLLKQEYLLTQ